LILETVDPTFVMRRRCQTAAGLVTQALALACAIATRFDSSRRRLKAASSGLIRLTSRWLLLAHSSEGAGYDAYGKEAEIHQSSRLPDFLPQYRRELEIDHSAVVKPHQHQEEQYPHEKHRLYNLHNTIIHYVCQPVYRQHTPCK
jgi:hypothetical protein